MHNTKEDEDAIKTNDSCRKSSSSCSSSSSSKYETTTTILRRFALLMDGASRAQILPYGPWLIYYLVGATEREGAEGHEEEGKSSYCWSEVGYSLSWLISAYIVGRWLGSNVPNSTKLQTSTTKLVKYVSRLGGVAVSLHMCLYYVAGIAAYSSSSNSSITNIRCLMTIRFLLALTCGLLYSTTRNISLPEDNADNNIMDDNDKRNNDSMITSVGEAKFYMTGFALSVILSGGLLLFIRQEATTTGTTTPHSSHYIPSSGSWSLLPLLIFISIAVGVEILLRRILFASSSVPTTTGTDVKPMKNAATGEEVVSLVGGMNDNNYSERTYESLNDQPHVLAGVKEEDGSSNNKDEEVGDTVGEFLDPLRMSNSSRGRTFSYDFLSPSRSRRESCASSVDEFFDCRSVLSEEFDETSWDNTDNNKETLVGRYVNHRCVYDDGSPAFVSNGNCIADVPSNFLEFYNGNQNRARRAWEDTQRWREEKRVWRIHTLPNPWFKSIKEAYPHFVHGHSKAGYPVIYEQPGRMNLKGLFRGGCDIEDMVGHYTFFMEFISNCICTRQDVRSIMQQEGPDAAVPHNAASWGIMVVMDISGAGLSHLSGDVVRYLNRASEINTKHYPLTMKRVFLVNSPFWLAGAWSGLKGILPESVQADILSEAKYPDALQQYIDEDQIPPEYGGKSPYNLGEHPYEVELRQLVEMANNCGDGDDEETLIEDFPGSSEMASFSNPVTTTTVDCTPEPSVPLRRRVNSVDRSRFQETSGTGFSYSRSRQRGTPTSSEMGVLVIVSLIYSIFTAVQGGLEVAIPLWILSPAHMGGLGYSPFRSGVNMFSASLVLLWTMRFKPSRLVSQLPNNTPLRAFRIGVGAESALLAGLTVVSAKTSVYERSDSIVVITSTIIMLSCLALAAILGRSACNVLHQIASEGILRRPKQSNRILGSLMFLIRPVSEVMGIFIAAPLLSWSLSSHRPAPFDGTCMLFITSLLNFVLYACTFSLHLNSAGKLGPHYIESSPGCAWRRWISFFGEAISVSAGDMASLFQEANWSSTPLLGHSRRRAFSDTLKMMERGEGENIRSDKAK